MIRDRNYLVDLQYLLIHIDLIMKNTSVFTYFTVAYINLYFEHLVVIFKFYCPTLNVFENRFFYINFSLSNQIFKILWNNNCNNWKVQNLRSSKVRSKIIKMHGNFQHTIYVFYHFYFLCLWVQKASCENIMNKSVFKTWNQR